LSKKRKLIGKINLSLPCQKRRKKIEKKIYIYLVKKEEKN